MGTITGVRKMLAKLALLEIQLPDIAVDVCREKIVGWNKYFLNIGMMLMDEVPGGVSYSIRSHMNKTEVIEPDF